MKKIALLVVTLLLPTSQSWAGWVDGSNLKSLCSTDSGFQDGMCLGYIFGVTEMLDQPKGIDSSAGTAIGRRYVCIPQNVVGSQLQAIVRKFLSENPEKLHWPAHILVNNAMIAAFPCGH